MGRIEIEYRDGKVLSATIFNPSQADLAVIDRKYKGSNDVEIVYRHLPYNPDVCHSVTILGQLPKRLVGRLISES